MHTALTTSAGLAVNCQVRTVQENAIFGASPDASPAKMADGKIDHHLPGSLSPVPKAWYHFISPVSL